MKFSPLQTREKGLSPRVILGNTPPPRTPPPRGGAREVKSWVFQKCGPVKTCSPPLLKISPILLKFGMIALKTLIQKPVDQIFDILSLRQDIGFQTWSNPKTKIKCRPGKTCSPPSFKYSPILLKFSMIAQKTSIQKIVDRNFDITVESCDFGPGSTKNLSLCNFFWIIFHLLPYQPPHKWRAGPKINRGRVYEITPEREWPILRPSTPRCRSTLRN